MFVPDSFLLTVLVVFFGTLFYCVCVNRLTLCNCLCSSPSSSRALPALSGISGNSEQKTILQTTERLMQYTVLKIRFRSLKYMAVIRIRNNLNNFPFLSKRYEARKVCRCIQPTPNSFQTLQTVCTCSYCMRNQLLCFWQMF